METNALTLTDPKGALQFLLQKDQLNDLEKRLVEELRVITNAYDPNMPNHTTDSEGALQWLLSKMEYSGLQNLTPQEQSLLEELNIMFKRTIALGKTHTGLQEFSMKYGLYNYSNWKTSFNIPDYLNNFKDQLYFVLNRLLKINGTVFF